MNTKNEPTPRACDASGEECALMQDENSGRDGRRYNEWHASRPDARLNAREAAASIAGQEQIEAMAALRAVQKIFLKNVTFVGGGPDSTVVVPFESHDQAWNHWHEAREIIRAALATLPAAAPGGAVAAREQEVSEAPGLMRAVRFIDDKRATFDREHGSYDYDTGVTEFGTGARGEALEQYSNDLAELADELRDLAAASSQQAVKTDAAPAVDAGERELSAQRLPSQLEERAFKEGKDGDLMLCTLAQTYGAIIAWANEPDEFHHLIKLTPSELRSMLRDMKDCDFPSATPPASGETA